MSMEVVGSGPIRPKRVKVETKSLKGLELGSRTHSSSPETDSSTNHDKDIYMTTTTLKLDPSMVHILLYF